MTSACYCQSEGVNQDVDVSTADFLKCSECGAEIHKECLKSKPQSSLINDFLFSMVCAGCSDTKEEVYTRPKKIPWLCTIMLILHNLQQTQESRHGYFHWKHHIQQAILLYSAQLFGSERKKSQSIAGTVAGCLSSYNGSIFQSGSGELGEAGWWRLVSNDPPFLSRAYKRAEQDKSSAPSDTSLGLMARQRKRKSLPEGFIGGEGRPVTAYKSDLQMSGFRSTSISSPLGSRISCTATTLADVIASDIPSALMEDDDQDAVECDVDVGDSEFSAPDVTMDSVNIYDELPNPEPSCAAKPLDPVDTSDAASVSSAEQINAHTLVWSSRQSPLLTADSINSGSVSRSRTDSPLLTEDLIKNEACSSRSQSPMDSHSSEHPEVEAPKPQNYVKINTYEEMKLLEKLNSLVEEGVKLGWQTTMLRRKLHVRMIKRQRQQTLFELSHYLNKPEMCSKIENSLLSAPVMGAGMSAPLVDTGVCRRVLDRFQTNFPPKNSTSAFVSFIKRLQGHGEEYLESVRSPFTSRVLKPFVWRDKETQPPKLALLKEIKAFPKRKDPLWSPAPDLTIDYCYVRPEHIPVINRICHQAFWPGIDLSECLQYCDFSCVALYGKLIIGFAFMVPDVNHNEAYVSFIYTHPEWRGAGIATFMMYHLIQTCMGKDVTLHVSVTNPALSLYLKFGFKVEEMILDFYEKYLPPYSRDCKHALFLRLERF